jgi:hypothetical protein
MSGAPTLTPRLCLRMARECEKHASEAFDPHIKATLLDLVRQWRALARQVEQLEHRPQHATNGHHRTR